MSYLTNGTRTTHIYVQINTTGSCGTTLVVFWSSHTPVHTHASTLLNRCWTLFIINMKIKTMRYLHMPKELSKGLWVWLIWKNACLASRQLWFCSSITCTWRNEWMNEWMKSLLLGGLRIQMWVYGRNRKPTLISRPLVPQILLGMWSPLCVYDTKINVM